MTAITLRGGATTDDPRLGRVPPTDWTHVEKWPLRGQDIRSLANPTPVGIGINWYRAFYAEQLIQRRGTGGAVEWWVREGDLGPRVGGHAITLEPFTGPHRDVDSWWTWHDQVSEGICVSEMAVRVMALLNRRRYQPRPIYDYAQTIDAWAGEAYEGTSADAGLATLRTRGAIPATAGERHVIEKGVITRPFQPAHGISANRWAVNDADVFRTLGDENAQAAVWLNSWGRGGYPHRVWVPRSVLARLRKEDGEFGIVTDR
jgi:hypothetical protein